jgi:aminodeoxychorismate synthase, subunit I (EC 6.3.5.8)
LQTHSEITGTLSENWEESIGSIIMNLLPAGSISGAPKRKL